MAEAYQPRRSCLYVPGDKRRALQKAQTLPADVLIMDLEDAVFPESKKEARSNVDDLLSNNTVASRRKTQELVIRINASDSPWGKDDLLMACRTNATAILIPKLKDDEDLERYSHMMDQAEAPPSQRLWAMIEQPQAIVNLNRIAAHAVGGRLSCLVMGTNDLIKAMEITSTPDRLALQYSLSLCVVTARAFGLSVIDGVYNEIDNMDGLCAETEQGKALGFDGKTLIHPIQIDPVNRIFSPGAQELEEARAIIAAFEKPENHNCGVITVNGRMTERLHLEQAKRLCALFDQER